jgi:23S rRNA pseudouridine1911/1915/1917 synthase
MAFYGWNVHHAAVAARPIRFTVSPEDAGLRLDQLLAKRVPELSRRTARKVLLIGGVFVEGARVKVASKIVQPGRGVEVYLGGALGKVTAAEQGTPPELDVVFEDDSLLVVDKPAGLPTAATRETDRNNLLFYLSQRKTSSHLHLVHRLDLETSGLLVVAKTAESAQRLSELFRTHALERVYRVVLLGPLPAARTVESPIEGRPARTLFVPVEHKGEATLAEARLETGRTHQIRVHASAIDHPVAGDRRYGRRTTHEPPRLALHALVLGFRHPATGQPMRFERDWPADLRDWW